MLIRTDNLFNEVEMKLLKSNTSWLHLNIAPYSEVIVLVF